MNKLADFSGVSQQRHLLVLSGYKNNGSAGSTCLNKTIVDESRIQNLFYSMAIVSELFLFEQVWCHSRQTGHFTYIYLIFFQCQIWSERRIGNCFDDYKNKLLSINLFFAVILFCYYHYELKNKNNSKEKKSYGKIISVEACALNSEEKKSLTIAWLPHLTTVFDDFVCSFCNNICDIKLVRFT